MAQGIFGGSFRQNSDESTTPQAFVEAAAETHNICFSQPCCPEKQNPTLLWHVTNPFHYILHTDNARVRQRSKYNKVGNGKKKRHCDCDAITYDISALSLWSTAGFHTSLYSKLCQVCDLIRLEIILLKVDFTQKSRALTTSLNRHRNVILQNDSISFVH